MTSAPPPSTTELHDLAVAAATEAADLVMEQLESAYEMETKSSSTDVVTAVDRAAEELIVDRLRTARPADGLIGEEGTGVEGTSGYSWLIDPIDGTTNFVYGLPGFTVSVAVGLDGAEGGPGSPNGIVAGCVVDPTHHDRAGRPRVFSAGRGDGALCNDRRLAVSSATDLATSLIATGFSYDPARRAQQASVLTTILPAVRDIRRFGSAALDLCFVAAGHVDAYFEVGLNSWDLAAGAVIAAEAGATVELLDAPNGLALMLASAPGIADELKAVLAASGALAV